MAAPARILLALMAGLAFGIVAAGWASERFTASLISLLAPIGDLWLNALRMTIVPLIVALLVTGIAAGAEAARSGRLALRSVLLFMAVLWTSALLAAAVLPILVTIWPLPPSSGEALRAALGATTGQVGEVPGIAEFLRGIVPSNPVAAAAGDATLPLITFTAVFGFAITRLPAAPRDQLVSLFSALADAMLVVIGWVLWIGPVGVFALAFVVGARAGGHAVGALIHYMIIVSTVGILIWLLAYPLARFAAGLRFRDFARALLPAQAVAVSTQSSLASLPPMLASAERLGVPVHAAGVTLPLAVALFRATGPAMNLAVALYIAHWFGISLGPIQIAAGVAAAAVTTMGAVSLPGQVSFFTSIAPIALVMGVPIEPLALLIAVETVPDIVRTVGNVTMDVAVSAAAAEGLPPEDEESGRSDGAHP